MRSDKKTVYNMVIETLFLRGNLVAQHMWEDNVDINLSEIVCEGVN